jgi:transcriptional regulator with XRE-family HTH domain
MLSQRQLADASGVALRQIQLFEQGQRDIKKTQGETLKRLAQALHCDMEELL